LINFSPPLFLSFRKRKKKTDKIERKSRIAYAIHLVDRLLQYDLQKIIIHPHIIAILCVVVYMVETPRTRLTKHVKMYFAKTNVFRAILVDSMAIAR
jgi:hypothetical protein